MYKFTSDINPSEKYELERNLNNNVIEIKILLQDLTYNDAKKLQLSYVKDGRKIMLNDNQFIPQNETELIYFINPIGSNDIVLKVKKNLYGIPNFIQIAKSNLISDLKSIFQKFYFKTDEFIYIFDENHNILDDNKTVEQCQLIDYSKIKVFLSGNKNVNHANNMFITLRIGNPLQKVLEGDQESVMEVECYIFDTISSLKTKISEKLVLNREIKLVLFSETSYLSDDKEIYDYPIRNNDLIFYADLIRKENISIDERIKVGKYADLYHGRHELYNERLAVNVYSMDNKTLKKFKTLKYEIITRLKLIKTGSTLFVSLVTMYEENNFFYIAMEYMEGGSIKDKLPILQLHDIIDYSIQILEALQFLHSLHILHRNMKCASVLLDRDSNVKLCNFHLAKFLYNKSTAEIYSGVAGTNITDSICWVAPEILSDEPYGFGADIWSFGAMLIEMVTRARPFGDTAIAIVACQIVENRTIEYTNDELPILDPIIEKCIKPYQTERPKISDLIEEFRQLRSNL